jgi:hypothetical protein
VAQPKTRVRPIRVYTPSEDLHTTVCSGRGFRFVASDGTKGPRRGTYREARKDARLYRLENAAPVGREDVAPTGSAEAS